MIGTDIRIVEAPFDPEEEARRLRRDCARSGAIVTFVGLVRHDGDPSLRLILEHCPGLTEKEVLAIAETARRRWPLDALVIRHRVGELVPAEPIVFVGAAAAHRRAAFEATDFIMDHLKSAAPFWKRERSAAGERWIEPYANDYVDFDRWSARP